MKTQKLMEMHTCDQCGKVISYASKCLFCLQEYCYECGKPLQFKVGISCANTEIVCKTCFQQGMAKQLFPKQQEIFDLLQEIKTLNLRQETLWNQLDIERKTLDKKLTKIGRPFI